MMILYVCNVNPLHLVERNKLAFVNNKTKLSARINCLCQAHRWPNATRAILDVVARKHPCLCPVSDPVCPA
jgi:hypothetical protein